MDLTSKIRTTLCASRDRRWKSMTSNTSSEAYREGYVAGASGQAGAVPQKYALGSKEANEWGDGWADGAASR